MNEQDRLMFEDCARSDLNKRDVEQLGFSAHTAEDTKDMTDWIEVPSYKINYTNPDGTQRKFFRLKLLGHVEDKTGRVIKYWQPPKSGTDVFLPQLAKLDWLKVAKDSGARLVHTEGEKKAACPCKHGIVTIASSGVELPHHAKGGVVFPDTIKDFNYVGRLVEVCYDGDANLNPNVRRAREWIASEFVARGAEVLIVEMPLGSKLDDFLVANGPDAYEKLPRHAFDAKAQVSFMRVAKGIPARVRRERISGIVKKTFIDGGDFYRTDDKELVYLDRAKARLHSLDDDIELHAATNERFGLNSSEAEWQFVLADLRAHGFNHGKPAQLYHLAHYDEAQGVLYLNAGNDRLFRITERGHTVVMNGTDGVIFRPIRFDPIDPDMTGTHAAIEKWLDVPYFQDDCQDQVLTRAQERLLLEAWFWTLLFPELHPTKAILLITGPLGSGKSDALRILGRLLIHNGWEPSVFNTDKMKDLLSALTREPFVAFDNADGAAAKGIENLVATAATGGEVQMAELYKTNKTVHYKLIAHIAAASREPNCFTRSDIVNRLLLLRCQTRTEYLAEADVLKSFRELRPKFWGYILGTAPSIIKALRVRKKSQTMRLADFAAFATALAPSIGSSKEAMQSALSALENERSAFSLSHSVLPAAIERWYESAEKEPKTTEGGTKAVPVPPDEITSGELFKALREQNPTFPYRTPQSFGLKLAESLTALRQQYNIVTRKGGKHIVFYSFSRLGKGKKC